MKIRTQGIPKIVQGKKRIQNELSSSTPVSVIIIGILVWRKGEVCTRFWWGKLRARDHWGDQDIDGRIILGWIFRKWEGVVRTGWSWLRIGTGGGHL